MVENPKLDSIQCNTCWRIVAKGPISLDKGGSSESVLCETCNKIIKQDKAAVRDGKDERLVVVPKHAEDETKASLFGLWLNAQPKMIQRLKETMPSEVPDYMHHRLIRFSDFMDAAYRRGMVPPP